MIRGAGRLRRCASCAWLDNFRHSSTCPECGRTCGGDTGSGGTFVGKPGLYPLPPDPDRALPGRVMDGRQLLAPVAAR